MSSIREHYEAAYQLARKVQGRNMRKEDLAGRLYPHSITPLWAAFWSLAQRKAYPPRYHWHNARRGEIFRSSRYLRMHDIPF